MATTAGVITKPAASQRLSWRSWLTTVDHKLIGIQYIVTAVIFFIVGGLEALLIRAQLAAPGNTLVGGEAYNQLFTMHGTTMVFLAIMPLNAGIANYIVPLMVGAEDMAFPRLNAFSYWLFLFAGVFMYTGFMFDVAPNGGWFAYAPLSTCSDRTVLECATMGAKTHSMDFWGLGLALLGVSSLGGALNFIVTIIKMRAPGMTFNRMPLFVWMTLVTSFLLIFALPSITVAIFMLFFDRNFGTHFFTSPQMGTVYGDPLLWQHLFWFFGHPEVYIMILPPMGMISEILPTFSRKSIFGYSFIAYSGVAIGFLGFTVWAHHMFAVGMGPVVNGAFAATTMMIGIPTGVKIFNWIGTLFGGRLRLTTAMLFALGFIAMFIIGGISGVMLGAPAWDQQATDSYFVVAHLHYVLFGGSMLGIFGSFFYWFPKMTGRMLSERLGKWQFWLTMLAFNVTFFPMHIVGILGMPRRVYTYPEDAGWTIYNLVQTIGAFALALSILIFTWNVMTSIRRGKLAGPNPWDGATLEWATASPAPAYNFAKVPIVRSRLPLWDIKYGGHGGAHSEIPAATTEDEEHALAHLPKPTLYPLIMAGGLTLFAMGPVYGILLTVVGLAITIWGFWGWIKDISIVPPRVYEDEEVTH